MTEPQPPTLSEVVRRAVEIASDDFWIEGEVASLKRAPSGHVYFTLKDEREDAQIDCVMYRFDAQRARRILTEGARLQLKGRATVWAPRGRLQLVGTLARLAGRGELLLALEPGEQPLGAARRGLVEEVARVSTRGWKAFGMHGAGNVLNAGQIASPVTPSSTVAARQGLSGLRWASPPPPLKITACAWPRRCAVSPCNGR